MEELDNDESSIPLHYTPLIDIFQLGSNFEPTQYEEDPTFDAFSEGINLKAHVHEYIVGFEKAKEKGKFYVLGFPRSGNTWLKKIIQQTMGERVAGCHPYIRFNHEPLQAKEFIYDKSIFVYRRDYKRVLFSLITASKEYTEKDLSTLLKLYCKMNREYLKSEIFSICYEDMVSDFDKEMERLRFFLNTDNEIKAVTKQEVGELYLRKNNGGGVNWDSAKRANYEKDYNQFLEQYAEMLDEEWLSLTQ
jgi:hypothetical protein